VNTGYRAGKLLGEPFHRARAAFADGQDSPRDYLERRLERLDAVESRLKAFVTLDVDGARRAADTSASRYRRGQPLSPIDGMPLGIKDVIDTASLPTQMGSAAFSGWMARRDAACVRALLAGGAIVLGKSVTTEFALGSPGPTTHPFDANRTPGGSSSGSAAAVAADIVPAALGTQEMGSLIRPASFCGVLGLKPSYGALHQGGVHGVAPSQSHLGVIAGSLQDMATVCAQIACHAGGDPGYEPLRLSLPVAAEKPARIGILHTEAWERMEGAARNEFLLLERRMAEMDVQIGPAADFDHAAAGALEAWAAICCWELRWPIAEYRDRFPNALGADTQRYLAIAERMTAGEYERACALRADLRKRYQALAAEYDALLLPAALGPAPLGLASTGSREFNAFSSGLGAPSITLPLLSVAGMPLGVQLIGFAGADARLLSHAAWLLQQLAPELL
jgi:Asp-tRNA(Asn)/Glu-tRNA(Gln) amidotransferase A subunit family amidase